MKTAVLSLLFPVCITWPAFAGPCSGAEAQLAKISKALTLNTVDTAENSLRALSSSYPDCPEIVLHQARLAQGGEALAAISVDGTVPAGVREELLGLQDVCTATVVHFRSA